MTSGSDILNITFAVSVLFLLSVVFLGSLARWQSLFHLKLPILKRNTQVELRIFTICVVNTLFLEPNARYCGVLVEGLCCRV